MEGSNEQNQVELTKRGRKRKIGKGDKVDDFSFRATRDRKLDSKFLDALNEIMTELLNFPVSINPTPKDVVQMIVTKFKSDNRTMDELRSVFIDDETTFDLWLLGYNKMQLKEGYPEVDKVSFTVNVMPKLKSSDYQRLIKYALNGVDEH